MDELEKQEIKTQIISELKAESITIEDLEVVDSLDSINTIPVLKGNKAVSVPVSLLAGASSEEFNSAIAELNDRIDVERNITKLDIEKSRSIYNISELMPTSGIGSSNIYDLDSAIIAFKKYINSISSTESVVSNGDELLFVNNRGYFEVYVVTNSEDIKESTVYKKVDNKSVKTFNELDRKSVV